MKKHKKSLNIILVYQNNTFYWSFQSFVVTEMLYLINLLIENTNIFLIYTQIEN